MREKKKLVPSSERNGSVKKGKRNKNRFVFFSEKEKQVCEKPGDQGLVHEAIS
jgi:hypothetical protein